VKIHFFVPPSGQTIGGLDLAIQSLRSFLESRGIPVTTNPNLETLRQSDEKQVVHFHGLWQFNFHRVSAHCRNERIPCMVSPHGMLEPWAWKHKWWKKWPYYQLWERPHLARAGRVLATSDMEAANLTRLVSREQIAMIPLGLPAEVGPDYRVARQKLGWRDDELIFLFLSRIHRKKGLDLLLRALEGISPQLPDKWRLVIVGDGDDSYLAECRRFLEDHRKLLPFVEWRGAVWGAEKWGYFQAADLYCLPSYSENFGLAILEACQTGTRALTSRYTPWTFLEEWKAGFLVEPTVESVQLGLEAFLAAREWSEFERHDLANRTHERFNWSRVGPLYMDLYEQLAAQ